MYADHEGDNKVAERRTDDSDELSIDDISTLRIDKKISITMIFALMLQFGALLWGASSVYTTQQLVNQKLELTVNTISERISDMEKATFTNAEAATLKQEINSKFHDLEGKINRLEQDLRIHVDKDGKPTG
jgi:hypothetical protein